MVSNRRSAAECAEPFRRFNNCLWNLNSRVSQILLEAKCRSCTDVENNPHKCPLQGTKGLHHGRKRHLVWLVIHLPPSRQSTNQQKEEVTTSEVSSRLFLLPLRSHVLHLR